MKQGLLNGDKYSIEQQKFDLQLLIDGAWSLVPGMSCATLLMLITTFVFLNWDPPIHDGALIAGGCTLLFAGLLIWVARRKHVLQQRLKALQQPAEKSAA